MQSRLPRHHDEEKRATPKHHWIIFSSLKKVRPVESNQEPEAVRSTSGMSEAELALHFLLLTIPHLSSPTPLPPPVTNVLACSLEASPYVPVFVLYYCASQGTVLSD